MYPEYLGFLGYHLEDLEYLAYHLEHLGYLEDLGNPERGRKRGGLQGESMWKSGKGMGCQGKGEVHERLPLYPIREIPVSEARFLWIFVSIFWPVDYQRLMTQRLNITFIMRR